MPAKTLFLFAVSATLLATGPSQATQVQFRPFGISRQTLPSSIDCKPVFSETPPDGTGQYACGSLPIASPGFQQYIIAYVADVGICNVTGVSPFIANDRSGAQTRAVFKKILGEMDREYGPPDERIDQVNDDGQADDNYFEDDVIAERRQVFDQWNSLKTVSTEAESASLIISGSEELGLSVYSVVRFSGNDACLEKLEAAAGSIGPQ